MTPVQVQKSLFLVGKKLEQEGDFYTFKPYDYGPFSKTIYHDLDTLAIDDYIEIQGGFRFREYVATDKGIDRAKAAMEQLDGDTQEFVENVVKWTQSLTFTELVTEIYKRYPETKINSVFRDVR